MSTKKTNRSFRANSCTMYNNYFFRGTPRTRKLMWEGKWGLGKNYGSNSAIAIHHSEMPQATVGDFQVDDFQMSGFQKFIRKLNEVVGNFDVGDVFCG